MPPPLDCTCLLYLRFDFFTFGGAGIVAALDCISRHARFRSQLSDALEMCARQPVVGRGLAAGGLSFLFTTCLLREGRGERETGFRGGLGSGG